MQDRELLIEAIKNRHSVRHYKEKEIPGEILAVLKAEIENINKENKDLEFLLVENDNKAFKGWASYGQFKGVSHYLVIAGIKDDKETDVLCGREGEKLVLLLQSLGLNSCWVGLTYKLNKDIIKIKEGHKIRCIIAFGYGENPEGKKHKIKEASEVSNIEEDSPQWFREGVSMALLAPTAVNQQKFRFILESNGIVKAQPGKSIVGYTHIDLGIAITHFLIGADKPSSIIKVDL